MEEKVLQQLKQRYDIIGNYEALNRALDVALQVAKTDLSVFITGENGVGKEFFPRIIHDNSMRKSKKYFAINCGSIPEGTIDSELFGHEKGAFTGAVDSREGYFGVANGGTLFLDEVGELPLSTQARLLRVLETGEYISVGSSIVKKTNVRIIAATNVNIPQAISEGHFREDLYYRLNTIPINVPPLRERGEDIALLFIKFAIEMSEKYNMPPIRLTPEAKQRILNYSWPGNIRQLRNLVQNMSVTSEERNITLDILNRYLPEDTRSTQLVTINHAESSHCYENEREILYKVLFELRRDVSELKKLVNEKASYQTDNVNSTVTSISPQHETPHATEEYVEDLEEILSMEDAKKDAIVKALNRHHGSRKDAADELGISERTMYRKIKDYDLE